VNIPSWEHFYHQADIGVRGIARSRAGAFEQAALALSAVVCDPGLINASQVAELKATAPDDDMLLVAWLNEIVSEMSARGMLFGRFEVDLEDHALRGRAWGEPVNVARHQPAVEVKGATLTGVAVECDAAGVWRAQCVVDV